MRKKKIHGGCTFWVRQTIESKIFSKPTKWFKIWFYLVSRANHTDNAGLKRGQGHLTYETIMLKCEATKAEVDHSIRWFKDRRMLATTKATRGFVVTILNYERYQNLDNYRSDRIDKNVIMEINGKKKSLHLQVFNHWNSYRSRSVNKRTKEGQERCVAWRSHTLRTDGSVSPDVGVAIAKALGGGYIPEQVIAAIDNYARLLFGQEYWRTHVWNLPDFLTVGEEKHKQAGRKWWRFLPYNFIEENYLTKMASRKRAEALRTGPSAVRDRKVER